MTMIKCHECKSAMSNEAAACPKCGAPINIAPAKATIATGKALRPWQIVAILTAIVGIPVLLVAGGKPRLDENARIETGASPTAMTIERCGPPTECAVGQIVKTAPTESELWCDDSRALDFVSIVNFMGGNDNDLTTFPGLAAVRERDGFMRTKDAMELCTKEPNNLMVKIITLNSPNGFAEVLPVDGGPSKWLFALDLQIPPGSKAHTSIPEQYGGAVMTSVLPCNPGSAGNCDDDVFQKVWLSIEANTGEVTKVDVRSISPMTTGSVWVMTYTSVPNTMFDMAKIRQLAFDCAGHYSDITGSGAISLDAPPRSVAGQVASLVCERAIELRATYKAREEREALQGSTPPVAASAPPSGIAPQSANEPAKASAPM